MARWSASTASGRARAPPPVVSTARSPSRMLNSGSTSRFAPEAAAPAAARSRSSSRASSGCSAGTRRPSNRPRRAPRPRARRRAHEAGGRSVAREHASRACRASSATPLCLSRRDAGGEVLALELVCARPDSAAHGFERPSWLPRISRLGSRSTSPHSPAAAESRRWARRSSRAASIQASSRTHWPSSASCADLDRRLLRARIPVEGEQPGGAERVEREGELPLVDVERVEVPALMRRRVSAVSPSVTRRRKSWRTASRPSLSRPW